MKKSIIYEKVKEFKNKYPMTVAWRLKAHSALLEKHLKTDEKVLYAFAAQKNNNPFDIITTYVIAITDKRIMMGQKRVFFGYFFTTITPEMLNDLTIRMGIIWGKICIDTIKEVTYLSNIQRKALSEIETAIVENVMPNRNEDDKCQQSCKNTSQC